MDLNSKCLIISNRLPYNYQDNKLHINSGGLVSAILGANMNYETTWMGSLTESESINWPNEENLNISGHKLLKIIIPDILYNQYYNGYSNNVIWPLFHYQSSRVNYIDDDWRSYRKTNSLFSDHIAKVSKPFDIIWVHDYHLLLVGHYLRKRNFVNKIGFFLHIPFPQFEVFKILPYYNKILIGMLKYDIIGFQTEEYANNFKSCIKMLPEIVITHNIVYYKGSVSKITVHPVSINYNAFSNINDSKVSSSLIPMTEMPLILGIDRLDYSKGLDLKLKGIDRLLEKHPRLVGNLQLVQIAVPTRENIEEYKAHNNEVLTLVDQINNKYSNENWKPIIFINQSINFDELCYLYQNASCLLVTSRRDGMNLVAMEYLASQKENKCGELIISEFIGVVDFLGGITTINPYNPDDIALKISNSFEKNNAKKLELSINSRLKIKSYTSDNWCNNFLSDLINYEDSIFYQKTGVLISGFYDFLSPKYQFCKNIKQLYTIFIDYDGTLVDYHEIPEKATLKNNEKIFIEKLSDLEYLDIVIVTGRNKDFILSQFEGIKNIKIAAEHGALFYDNHDWKSRENKTELWKEHCLNILTQYTQQYEGSCIEEKDFSIVWHYRNIKNKINALDYSNILLELGSSLSDFDLNIEEGHMIIEIKEKNITKGIFIRNYIDKFAISDGCVIGDDISDETMFGEVYNSNIISIKIGSEQTCAKYRLNNYKEVYTLLHDLYESKNKYNTIKI